MAFNMNRGFTFNFRPSQVNQLENHVRFIGANFQSTRMEDNNGKYLDLYNDKSYINNLLKILPRNFKLTTNNGFSLFNDKLLEDTSSVISNFLTENSNCKEFHLDIEDKYNVLSKFEKLFLGESVYFVEDELPTSIKITDLLNIKCCPNYLKPENLKSIEFIYTNMNPKLEDGVQIYLNYSFLTKPQYLSFTIFTKHKEYKCNYFGIFSSNIIREIMLKNPNTDCFNYDFDDENDEFQEICNFFNFRRVEITSNNVETLKKMAENLQIEIILSQIDKYFDEIEEKSKKIDEQENSINSIEELFGWLYDIQKLTVESTKTLILNSKWIKKEDNVIELAAFIIQVINSSLNLHPFIMELLIQLDKESNQSNKLSVLYPFVVKQSMFSLGVNLSNCSFVYNLYKKGVISKEDLINQIKENYNEKGYQRNIKLWVWPELKNMNLDFSDELINSNYHDKLDLFIKMRDIGYPNDELTNALRKDDVDTAQTIIINNSLDLNKYLLPFNIFDDFQEYKQMNLINYASACGSIKCFKYFVLNHCNIDELTFYYAVYGGNIEIIRTVDQNKVNTQISNNNNNSVFNIFLSNNNDNILRAILISIAKHNNNLFDWLIEQKYIQKVKNFSSLLLSKSVINGNVHSFIEIIDKCEFPSNFQELIEISSKKGFYKLACLIYDFSKKNSDENKPNFENYSYFGNLSIFKFGLKCNKIISFLPESLSLSVKKEYTNIFNYFFDVLIFEDNSKLDINLVRIVSSEAIKSKSDYYLNHLIEQIKKVKPNFFSEKTLISFLFEEACKTNNLNRFKIIYNLFEELYQGDSKFDMATSFINAAKSGSLEILQFIIKEKRFTFNIQKLFSNLKEIGSLKKDIFSIIMDISSPELKESFLSCSLYPAIENKNIELVEYLLNKNVVYENALFKAIETNNLDIVNIVLKHNSDHSFINKLSKNGTALCLATKKQNLLIVKRLLSIPEINPNLYDSNFQNPLIIALNDDCPNFDLQNLILDFCLEKNQLQSKQFDKIIEILLGKIDNIKKRLPGNNDPSNLELLNKTKSILYRILEMKNFDPNLKSNNNLTLLSYACEENEINIVKILLEIDKIDVNAYEPINGNTPLMIAIKKQNFEIIDLLINDKRTNINARNFNNQTALLLAVENNLEKIVSLIINDEKFDPKESLLDYAFYISKGSISKLLISSKSLDVNYKVNIEKQTNIWLIDQMIYSTPLLEAIKSKDIERINLITQHPSFDKVKSQIINCIFYSVYIDDINIFKLLIKLVDNDVNILNDSNSSLLLAAINYSSIEIVDEIVKNEKFEMKTSIEYILLISLYTNNFSVEKTNRIYDIIIKNDHSFDINKYELGGRNYFTWLVNNNNNQIEKKINFLLEHGADPNLPDKNGFYPLEYAILLKHFAYVQSLLNYDKIDLNKQISATSMRNYNKYKNINAIATICLFIKFENTTYFHLAATSSNEIFNLFLKRESININEQDDQGNTPLIYATAYNCNDNIISLFNYEGDQKLDYLHKNKSGKDALSIKVKNSNNIQDKLAYKDALIKNTSSSSSGFTFNFGNK